MRGGWSRPARTALFAVFAVCLAYPALAQGGAPSGPGYEVVSSGPILELRFHGIPLKSVHADDAQNALSLDFNSPVDGAVFDHLNSAMPQWIAMAYSNYDNGVIRAARPVTFLTRPETDGFSLRIVPRDGAVAQLAPPDLRGDYPGAPAPSPYPQQAYPQQGYPQQPYPPQGYPQTAPMGAPPQVPYAPYQANAATRNYYGLQYAIHRADPLWGQAYDQIAIPGDSQISLGSEYHHYHNGDAVIGSAITTQLALGGGLALIGGLADTDTKSDQVRASNGTFLTNNHTNDISGSAGVAMNIFGQTRISLEGLVGNGLGGGRFGVYSGNLDGFTGVTLTYHQPYLDTPEAVMSDGFKDEGQIAIAQRLTTDLWASLAGRFDNYGVHGIASTTRTASWDGNLRWDIDLDGLSAALAYDGHGEYRLNTFTLAGTAPTPYVPLSIRNIETHSVIASLSSLTLGSALWFDLYGGYVYDRYSSDGALYGAGVHYQPVPSLDLELGARHSTVSFTQGEIGAQSSVGLNLTFGFNGLNSYGRMF